MSYAEQFIYFLVAYYNKIYLQKLLDSTQLKSSYMLHYVYANSSRKFVWKPLKDTVGLTANEGAWQHKSTQMKSEHFYPLSSFTLIFLLAEKAPKLYSWKFCFLGLLIKYRRNTKQKQKQRSQ